MSLAMDFPLSGEAQSDYATEPADVIAPDVGGIAELRIGAELIGDAPRGAAANLDQRLLEPEGERNGVIIKCRVSAARGVPHIDENPRLPPIAAGTEIVLQL